MEYNQYQLKGFEEIIPYIWEIKLKKSEIENGYCLMPDNHGEVMINLGQALQKRTAGHFKGHLFDFGEVHWYNCRSKGIIFSSENDIHLLSAKINPGYFSALIPSDGINMRDKACHSNFPMRSDQMDAIARLREVITIKLRTQNWAPDPIVAEGIQLIRERKGGIRICDVYGVMGISKSSLEQKFLRELTITPKEFCKIEKLQGFMSNYQRYHHNCNLTQLTFQSGYYDQSHFIKDFRYVMDMTPRSYFRSTAYIG